MIKSINLVNCQSIENVTYNLASDRVNVICADNNVGKSVLFKMLKFFTSDKYYSPSQRKELIRWGADYALISITLDTDEIFSVGVFPKSVVYFYQKDSSSELEQRECFSFDELKHIGLLTKDNFIANSIDNDKDMLFVSSNQATDYYLMDLLVHDNVIENLQSKVSEELSNAGVFEQELVKKRVAVESLLSASSYQNLDELKETKEYVETLTHLLEKLASISEILDDFLYSDGFKYNDAAYSLLNKLVLPTVNILDTVDISSHLSILDKLNLPQVEISDCVDIEQHLRLLNALLLPSIENENEYNDAMTEAFNELQSKSDIVECPLHGKVVSMYDKCLYLD